jgi:hypothetical protein
MNRWISAAMAAPVVGAASLFFALPAAADEYDCAEDDVDCIYEQGYADAEGDYDDEAGGDNWAGDAGSALGIGDPSYEWGGVASPYLNVCTGVDTVIPFVAFGGCSGDLTAGEIMP